MSNKIPGWACLVAFLLFVACSIAVCMFCFNLNKFDRAIPITPDSEVGDIGVRLVMGESADDFHYKQIGFHADGTTKRIEKCVFKNKMPYLAPSGHHVLYTYFRDDGSKERTKLVFPYVSLGASVLTKSRVIYFAEDGQTELLEHYVRKDGTIGTEIDNQADTFTIFRADGKTLRYQQAYQGSEIEMTYYRLDGKTVWWRTGAGNDHIDVYFDRRGDEFERVIRRKRLVGSFSMGSDDPPFAYLKDSFETKEGQLEFRQTWYHAFNPTTDNFHEILAKVEVFQPDGVTVAKEFNFEVDPTKPRSVSNVVVHNADGSRLVRSFRSNGSRLTEKLFNSDGELVESKSFGKDDSFVEESKPYYFDALGGVDPYGLEDSDLHDI